MRKAIIAGVGGTATLFAGVVLPRTIPETSPYTYGLIVLTVVLYLIAWFLHRREATNGNEGQTSYGPHSPIIGTNHGTINFGSPSAAAIQPPKSPYGSVQPPTAQRPPMEISPVALAEASGLPSPEPDLPFSGLLVRLYKIMGPPPPKADTAARRDFYRKIDLEIGDKVHRKRLCVWGRVGDLPLNLIRASTLAHARFDHRQQRLTAANMDAVRATVYDDIYFNKEEVKRIWPDD